MSEFDELSALPAGSVETERITIRAYLQPDGSSHYDVQASGANTLTSYLGLLVIGQHDVLNWIGHE